MKKSISVVISAHNEAQKIEGAIRSAKLLTDDVYVVDIESNDNTAFIAKKLGAVIFSYPFTPYVEPSREFAIKQVNTDWVLILDADERISKELAKEILNRVEDNVFTHYKIPRKNIFGNLPAGGWLKYGGWWPDYQIRLISKKYFVEWPKEIHSTPIIQGQCGYLKTPLLHFFHGNFEEMVKKTIIFENIESDLLLKAGRKVSAPTFFRKFLGELYRRLIKNKGFLDGAIGIIESVYQAFSKTITYLFLYEKKARRSI